jgi:hypothetical protein
MQIKASSGSASGGLSLLGTGIAMLLPDAHWVGWLFILAGFLVFVFDIHIENSHIATTRTWAAIATRFKKPRIVTGTLILLCLVVGFPVWYFWPTSHSDKPIILATVANNTNEVTVYETPELTIVDLWRDDFWNIGSFKALQGLRLGMVGMLGVTGPYTVGIGLYGDFAAKSLFMSLYVPSNMPTFSIIWLFSDNYEEYLNAVKDNVLVIAVPNGDKYQPTSSDLIFTKEIYIYYEDIMSEDQILKLQNFYRICGLHATFRGPEYLDHERLAKRQISQYMSIMLSKGGGEFPPYGKNMFYTTSPSGGVIIKLNKQLTF